MLSILIDIFWLPAVAILLGLAISIYTLVRLPRWRKALSALPLAISILLFPVLLPTGVWGLLTEEQTTNTAFDFESLNPAPGWDAELLISGYQGIRMMEITDYGDLLVTNPVKGELLIFRKRPDGGYREPKALLSRLKSPQGLALHDKWIYIGEISRIARIGFDSVEAKLTSNYEVLIDGLPDNGAHSRKSIGFGPDGALYVTVGSTCNACVEEDERNATIMRFDLDEEGRPLDEGSIYASGLRYSVGFAWNNEGRMFAADNGRDMLGDDYPPCELNEIVEGGFYGFPYVVGFNEDDPDFGDHSSRPEESIAPRHGFRAHNAPLGMTFLRRSKVPGYRGAAVVALHGSWNRSDRDGYKVVSLHFDENGKVEERELLGGFLRGEERLGRPVDVYETEAGYLLISDDYSGSIIRMKPGKGEVKDGRTVQYEAVAIKQRNSAAQESLGQRELRQGGKLFRQHCQRCHGDQDGLIPLVELNEHYDFTSLNDLIASPPVAMPRIDLSLQEREYLTRYLLSDGFAKRGR